MKLTQAQIELLCWARKTGAAFPFRRADGGGARRRMALRLVDAGLLALPFGLTITAAGREAVKIYDDFGNWDKVRAQVAANSPTSN